MVFDVKRRGRERIDQALPGHPEIPRILERCCYNIRRFQRNRELMPEAGVICGRKKRRQRRHHRNRRKTKITLAVLRLF